MAAQVAAHPSRQMVPVQQSLRRLPPCRHLRPLRAVAAPALRLLPHRRCTPAWPTLPTGHIRAHHPAQQAASLRTLPRVWSPGSASMKGITHVCHAATAVLAVEPAMQESCAVPIMCVS